MSKRKREGSTDNAEIAAPELSEEEKIRKSHAAFYEAWPEEKWPKIDTTMPYMRFYGTTAEMVKPWQQRHETPLHSLAGHHSASLSGLRLVIRSEYAFLEGASWEQVPLCHVQGQWDIYFRDGEHLSSLSIDVEGPAIPQWCDINFIKHSRDELWDKINRVSSVGSDSFYIMVIFHLPGELSVRTSLTLLIPIECYLQTHVHIELPCLAICRTIVVAPSDTTSLSSFPTQGATILSSGQMMDTYDRRQPIGGACWMAASRRPIIRWKIGRQSFRPYK